MNARTWMKWMGGAVAAASLALAGCDGHDDEVDEELCTHLKGGASRQVTAKSEAEGAPAIARDHNRYEIALPESNGQRAGQVRFAVDQGDSYVFGLSRDVPLEIRRAGGGEAVSTTKTTSNACAELAAVHTVDLEVGTWELRFGPTSEQAVHVVVEFGHHE